MRSVRTIALGAGALLACLLVGLVALPFFFRDRIAAQLRTAVNGAVNARVTWDGFGVSLLRDFPNVAVDVDRLGVVGVKPFDGDTLLTLRNARLVLDAGSVVGYLRRGAPIVIRAVTLRQPVARLRVLADGRANWDIARPQPASRSASSRAVAVTLRDFELEDGSITVDDQHAHTVASVSGLRESLRGDFARDRLVIATRTHADSMSLRFGGIPWLSRVALELDADVAADLAAHRFTVRNDSLRLNRLVLAFGGTVTTGTPNTTLDLTFSTPSTAFREILSLVPAIYARDFASVQTAGTMSVAGRVRGTYGPHAFPALAVRANVRNGAFKYASLPLPARDIALDLAIDNPGGHVDSTVVSLKQLHATIGGRPLDAALVVRTPVSDPDVDLRLRGGLNLADLARTVELPQVTGLAGQIAADVAMHTRLSDVDAGRYDRVAARGSVDVGHVALRSTTLARDVAVDTAALRLTPRTAQLTAFAARIGRSDVRATGSLDDVLGFALRGEDLRGSATVSSHRFDLDEWRSKDSKSGVIPVPPHVDFALKASVDSVTYGALAMANVRGDLRVRDRRVTLDSLRMDMLRGSVVANGYYETVVADHPTFDVDVRLASVDVPSAFAALTTVQKLAPLARWAQGGVSGTVALNGPLDGNMLPVFSALSGKGAIETERLVVQKAPVFEKLASTFSLDQLRTASLGTVRAAFDVASGRVRVKPAALKVAGMDLTVSGSHGFDQSLAYDVALGVPHSALGPAASGVVTRLASQAGSAAGGVAAAAVVQLGARIAGTVTDPTVSPRFAGTAGSLQQAAQGAIRQAGAARLDSAKQKADSAAAQARARAQAAADRIVAQADSQAASMRAAARTIAANTRSQADARADSLTAKATNPVARIAAKAAGDRLRQDADRQADRIVREADARADALVADAKHRAGAVTPRATP